LSVATRTDASSSTTEITESMDKAGLPEEGRAALALAPPLPKVGRQSGL
jgi:hypothetical protein